MIQFEISVTNRAATKVCDDPISTAVTSASASRDPSLFVSLNLSPNSIGSPQRKITSREVPYSRTVVIGSEEPSGKRSTSTGTLTLVPCGKNCAKRSSSPLGAPLRAFPSTSALEDCVPACLRKAIKPHKLWSGQTATHKDVQSACQTRFTYKRLILWGKGDKATCESRARVSQ